MKACRSGSWVSTVLLSGVLVVGTFADAAKTSDPAPAKTAPSTLAQGYALLDDLLGDEKNVSKLLLIKRDRPEFKVLVKLISDKTGKAQKELEKLAKSDGHIDLKNQGLPNAELETRKSISKEKSKALLAEKGDDFELHLLLAQNEALTYGAHLASTIAKTETEPKRTQFLQQVSGDLFDLRNKVFSMLRENYRPTAPAASTK